MWRIHNRTGRPDPFEPLQPPDARRPAPYKSRTRRVSSESACRATAGSLRRELQPPQRTAGGRLSYSSVSIVEPSSCNQEKILSLDLSLFHSGVGSKKPGTERCCLTTSSFNVMPRPGLSGTVMKPLLTIGFSTPSTIESHHGTSTEWFSIARKLLVAAMECTPAIHATGVPAK